jgi:PadR family transcriptional regulator, regulatory protein AphA
MPKAQTIAHSLSPEYVVLGLLKLQPSHGYALHRRLDDELSHVWRVSLSQVYNVLHRLEKHGHIKPSDIDSSIQQADRVPYRITRTGDRYFESWMRTPVGPSVRAIRMAFITKLYFAHHLGAPSLEDLIKRQRSAIETQLEQLDTRFNAIPRTQVINRLGLQLRIKQLQSLEAWFEETINNIPSTLEREK